MRISDWSSDVCSSDLQFLAGIILAAKPVHQLAVEPRDMAAGVTKFVERRPIIVDLIEEGGLRRHLHIILARHVKGLVAADAIIDPRCRDRKSTRLNSSH